MRSLGDILDAASREEAALLVTDNPLADQDVPRWVSIRGYHILETRSETPLKYYVIGKARDTKPAEGLRSTA